MLTQPSPRAVRRSLPCLAGGNRFRFQWGLNLAKLPRLSFNEGLQQLKWYEVRELSDYLERMGHLGDTTVAELILELDGYLGKSDQAEHDAAYRVRADAARADHQAYTAEVAAADAAGFTHAQMHLTFARLQGQLPRLAAFYGRLAGRKVGA